MMAQLVLATIFVASSASADKQTVAEWQPSEDEVRYLKSGELPPGAPLKPVWVVEHRVVQIPLMGILVVALVVVTVMRRRKARGAARRQ